MSDGISPVCTVDTRLLARAAGITRRSVDARTLSIPCTLPTTTCRENVPPPSLRSVSTARNRFEQKCKLCTIRRGMAQTSRAERLGVKQAPQLKTSFSSRQFMSSLDFDKRFAENYSGKLLKKNPLNESNLDVMYMPPVKYVDIRSAMMKSRFMHGLGVGNLNERREKNARCDA